MEKKVDVSKNSATTSVCRIPPKVVGRTYYLDNDLFKFIRVHKIGVSLLVVLVIVAGWSPWITEDYASNVVVDSLGGPDATYFYLGENVSISEIPIYTWKVPFAMFVYFPGEAMFIVPFWGGVFEPPSLGLSSYGD